MGMLKFGEFDGVLPFNFQVKNVALYPDSSSYKAVFNADSVSANLDVLSLMRSRFVITGLTVKSPSVIIDSQSDQSLLSAVQKKFSGEYSGPAHTDSTDTPFVEILAPSVLIEQGSVKIRSVGKERADSLIIRDINLDMFLDYNRNERYLDIERLTMNIPDYDLENVSLYGQIFNDGESLELNAFNIRADQSVVRFRGKADKVDILKNQLVEQLKLADIQLQVDETHRSALDC